VDRLSGIYSDITFPPAPDDRPYVVVNMVSTLDGKIFAGERDELVGLGSAVDKATMRQIESAVDGILIGHTTLKASPGLWYPPGPKLYVVSGSGQVERKGRFFVDDPTRSYVVTTHDVPNALRSPGEMIDWEFILRTMRHEHGVRVLLGEGGSELNASLFEKDLVDELFLTLAPVVKLGREVPTIAGGKPLLRTDLRRFTLVSAVPSGDELFLRYQRSRAS